MMMMMNRSKFRLYYKNFSLYLNIGTLTYWTSLDRRWTLTAIGMWIHLAPISSEIPQKQLFFIWIPSVWNCSPGDGQKSSSVFNEPSWAQKPFKQSILAKVAKVLELLSNKKKKKKLLKLGTKNYTLKWHYFYLFI